MELSFAASPPVTPASRGARVRRPLVGLAVALALGQAVGVASGRGVVAALVALLVIGALVIAKRAIGARAPGAPGLGELALVARGRRGRWPRCAPRVAVWLLAAAVGAGRAASHVDGAHATAVQGPADVGTWMVVAERDGPDADAPERATASVGPSTDVADDGSSLRATSGNLPWTTEPTAAPGLGAALPARGRWRPRSRDGTLGRLVPDAGDAPSPVHGLELALEGGAPRAGERLEVLATNLPRPPARGPATLAPTPARATVPPDAWRRPTPRAPSTLDRRRARLRAAAGRRLAEVERRTGTHGLLQALLLGDVHALPFETRDLFTRTGTRHLLAISGLHVGLVALLVVAPWRRARRAAAVCATATLLAWAWIAGAAPPIVRAVLAVSCARGLAWFPRRHPRFGELLRRADGPSLLALAALVELLRDPRAVGSTSVQLSYGATAALVGLAGPWARWWTRALPRASNGWALLGAGPVERTARALVDRLAAAVVAALAASTVASVATLPVLWWTFGETSWASVPATPLALPPLAALLLGAFGALVGVPGAAELARVAGDALLALLGAFDACPGTPTLLPVRPRWWLVSLATGTLALPWLPRGARLAVLVAAAATYWRAPATVEHLEVHALDVGDGSALVVRSPRVGALVFDGGSRDRRRVWDDALAPVLAAWEIRDVHVVLSHEDLDHRSALPSVVTRLPCRSFGGPAVASVEPLLPPDVLRWDGDGARLRLGDLELELVRGARVGGNEGSRSLVVRWRGRAVLLSGDAEEHGLARSLERGDLDGPFDLVLLPHHGGTGRHFGRFLERTRPARVWISGSRPERAGPELERRGLVWETTARDGPLVLALPPADR